MKYGARHLKRAIERSLVHPLSNLIASDQVRGGDLVRVEYDSDGGCLSFTKEAEDLPAYAMVQMMESSPASFPRRLRRRPAKPNPPAQPMHAVRESASSSRYRYRLHAGGIVRSSPSKRGDGSHWLGSRFDVNQHIRYPIDFLPNPASDRLRDLMRRPH